MAGLPSTTITFAAAPPRIELIGSLVQSRGGLPVEGRVEHDALRLHFACLPDDEVEVRASSGGSGGLVVTDWTLQGGSLYQVVCKVLVEAGGASNIEWGKSLRLPLTEAAIRRERRGISIASALLTLALAVTAVAILAGIVFILWKVVESAI